MDYENIELYDYLEQQKKQLKTIEQKELLRLVSSASKELNLDEVIIKDLLSLYKCSSLKENLNVLKTYFINENMNDEILKLPACRENENKEIIYSKKKNLYRVSFVDKAVSNLCDFKNDGLEIESLILRRKQESKDIQNDDEPLQVQKPNDEVIESQNSDEDNDNQNEEAINKVGEGRTSAFNSLLNRNKYNEGD